MGRSHSTPGLVESKGRVPLERMEFTFNNVTHLPSHSNADTANKIRSLDESSLSEGSQCSYRSRRGSAMPVNLPRFLEPNQHPARSETVASVASCDSDKRSTLTSYSVIPSPLTSPAFTAHSTLSTHATPITSSQDGRRGSTTNNVPVTSHSVLYHSEQIILPASLTSYSSQYGNPVVKNRINPALEQGSLQPEALVAEINRLRERLVMLESENASLSAKLNRQQWEVENRLAEIEMQICGAASPIDSATDDNERNFESAI